ncbi:hypothetical protein ACOSQ2_015951 [Xanthoceras sorbifolium]
MKEEREMAERCDEGGGSGTGGLCIAKVAMEGWRLSLSTELHLIEISLSLCLSSSFSSSLSQIISKSVY